MKYTNQKIRTIALPTHIDTILRTMKDKYVIVSVSEFIRKAVENQLKDDLSLIKNTVEDGKIITMIQEVVPEVLEAPTTITINGRVWHKAWN